MWGGIKNLDFYPKTLEEFREKTLTGATISILSLVVIVLLVLSELHYFLRVDTADQLMVDTSAEGKISIYMDITFPAVPCDALSLDLMDVTGEHTGGLEHTVFKSSLDLEGNKISTQQQDLGKPSKKEEKVDPEKAELMKALQEVKDKIGNPAYCGSCYGAEDEIIQCCNTCEDVRNAYHRKNWAFHPNDLVEQCKAETIERKLNAGKNEGCNIHGVVVVNKVAGNFHFAPGKSFQFSQSHVHDLMPFEAEKFNVSHVINRLGFGDDYPGLKNPLDNVRRIVTDGSGLFQYFVKVVPTEYHHLNGDVLKTNQYSVTENFRPKKTHAHDGHGHGHGHDHGSGVMPGVFFMYDLSPIMVNIQETRKSFVHFLTSLCAIVGGVFTVAGILDSFLYHGIRQLKKKIDLGKAG